MDLYFKMKLKNNILWQNFLRPIVRPIVSHYRYARWMKKPNKYTIPHIVKEKVVIDFAKKENVKILVETGTMMGAMIDATKNVFDKIFSIEIDETLYELARKKYRKYPHIKIVCGDSAIELPKILTNLKERAIFWLDAHLSSSISGMSDLQTPIQEEIEAVLRRHNIEGHIVLIDDARCFNGTHDYPKIEEFKKTVFKINPKLNFLVKDDIIRIYE